MTGSGGGCMAGSGGGFMAGSGGLSLDGLLSSTGATETSHQRGLRLASSGGSWATTVEHFDCLVV
jgi:hypothetical protein